MLLPSTSGAPGGRGYWFRYRPRYEAKPAQLGGFRLAVLNRVGVDYVQIVLGSETIQIDVFDDGNLGNAKRIMQEIVDRTNARADD
jgi:hypothetical protein